MPGFFMDDDGFTILCKNTFIELFEKTKGFTLSKGPFCIEPIVHLIWLGEKKYPEYARPVLKEWMMLNLQFQFILWVDSDENLEPFFENLIVKKIGKDFKLRFLQKAYDAHSSFAGKSDILRMELLYHFGGMYTDYDNRCIQCLEPLFTLVNFFGCFEYEETFNPIFGPLDQRLIDSRISNCVIGFKKEHPLVKEVIDRMVKAHAFFLKKNSAILNHQIIYATYIHVTSAFYDYIRQKERVDGIVFPKELAWKTIRLKKTISSCSPFFEINFLPSVGWFGQAYEVMNDFLLLALAQDNN